MPANRSNSSRFLHVSYSRSHSQSPQSSPSDPLEHISISAHDPRLSVSHASSSSRPSSRFDLYEKDIQAATGTSRPSALGNETGFQHSASHPPIYRAPDASHGQYLWPVNHVDFVASPSPRMTSASPYVLPSQPQQLYPPDPGYGPRPPRSMVPRYSPYRRSRPSHQIDVVTSPSPQMLRPYVPPAQLQHSYPPNHMYAPSGLNQIGPATVPSPHAPSLYVSPSQPQSTPPPPKRSQRPTPPQSFAPQPVPHRHGMSSQEFLNSQHVIQPSGQYSQQSQDNRNTGMFNQAHSFSALGAFVDGNVGTVNFDTSNQFMRSLLKETIPGAAFDSSARYPPPRCHPGTRLAILARCLEFIATCSGQTKIRWVVGAAGVGKSAIMQSVAESLELPVNCHASVFFSITGRNDGTKAIITISYQLAAKSQPYRHIIESEIERDPSLLHASMPVQFQKLIVTPFIHDAQLNSLGRVLIIIDGLDECSDPLIQQELLRLISDFCITYPSSPIAWLIASRPETQITSFFSRTQVIPAYDKEEILVDSDEARADVERFLRAELTNIKTASGLPDPQWPKEVDFWKIANASGGLFAYAQTVARYIGDSNIGSPVLQLSDVLSVIDNYPMSDLSRENHPMALLDALYAQILSRISPKIMVYTRKFLLALSSNWTYGLDMRSRTEGNFVLLCNWLGMTPEEAYAAFHLLHSVFRVPTYDHAHKEKLGPFHKSFMDYISDHSRSGFSPDIEHAARQLMTQCAFRVLGETSGICYGHLQRDFLYGCVTLGSGICNSLTWLVNTHVGGDDDQTRLEVHKLAIGEVIVGMERKDPAFLNVFCFRLLATRFEGYELDMFPFIEISNLLFDDSRRNDLITHGVLKRAPLKIVQISTVLDPVKVRFRRPLTVTSLSDPWNSCEPVHWQKGECEEGKDIDWTTILLQDGCGICYQRFRHQLHSWRIRFPDLTITIMPTSTGICCVEVRFVDSEDGMSEWTYWFWCRVHLSLEECRKYEIVL